MVRTIFNVIACTSLLCIAGMAFGSLNDPMKPDDFSYSPQQQQRQSIAAAIELKLSLILINGNVRRAIINGDMKREGDSVQGSKVTRINKDNVVLTRNGHLQTLYLLGSHGR